MKTALFSASLLALVAPTVAASGSDRFLELDAELARLAQAGTQGDQDPRVGALLRVAFDDADSELSGTPDDISGFRMYDAQLWFSSYVGDFEVFVKADAGETSAFPPITGDGVGPLTLRDAWVRTPIAENVQLYWGQYKCPLVLSGNVGDGRLVMIDRTRIGQLFSAPGAYQPGAAVMADFGPIHLKFALQNGADSAADGWGIVARGEFQFGDGAKTHEGAFGSPEGFNATVGLGYFTDDSQIAGEDFGSALALDGYATINALSFHAEILDADEELASRALGNVTDDATPYSATVGFLFAEQYEAVVRFQDLDNEVDATIVGAGLNRYVNGHAAKWQINVSRYEDDVDEGTILQVGLSVGLDSPH